MYHKITYILFISHKNIFLFTKSLFIFLSIHISVIKVPYGVFWSLLAVCCGFYIHYKTCFMQLEYLNFNLS